MPFKPWGFWPRFMIGAMLLVAVGALVGPIVAPSTQTFTVAVATSGFASYIAWRYWQGRQRLAWEHKAYLPVFSVNVSCVEPSTNERWNFGVRDAMVAAFLETEDRLTYATLREGFQVRIVRDPFPYVGTKGLNNGIYDWDRGFMQLCWPEGEAVPRAMHHEAVHVMLGRSEGIYDNEAAHARMKELGLPW